MIKSIRLRWAGHVARMEEDRSVFKILTGKSIGTRLLEYHRCTCEDNIRMNRNTTNWIDSVKCMDYWRALVNATLNLRNS